MSDVNHIYRVAILGGGPIGLSAAAHLSERGSDFIVLEKGPEVGHAIRQWGHVRVFSPWKYNIDAAARRILEKAGWAPPSGDQLPTGHEFIDQYLKPLADCPEIAPRLRFNANIVSVGRMNLDKVRSRSREDQPFEIRLEDGGRYFASAVIDATGTWFSPNPMGSGGYPALGEEDTEQSITYGIPDIQGRDKARFSGKTVMVVGAGYSAINCVVDLVNLSEDVTETTIVWAMRRENPDTAFGGEADDALPARGALGAKARKLVVSGAVELLTPFMIERVEPFGNKLMVSGFLSGGLHRVEVDEVIVTTGFRPDLEMIREIRTEFDPWLETTPALAPLIDPNVHGCGTVRPHGYKELSHPEQDFYVIGSKSYGRAPTYLLATGFEQARSVVAALSGDFAAADEVQLNLPETGVCGVSKPAAASTPAAGTVAVVAEVEADAGCCGGPAPEGVDACCVRDADAKTAGEAGCGCSDSPPEEEPLERVAAGSCC